MWRRVFTACSVAVGGLGLGGSASACGIALILAVDVSGSVDATEFDIQMQGLADGLRDDAVRQALVAQEAQVLILQWTGTSRQRVVVPWTQLGSLADVDMLAVEIEQTQRVWRNFSTAIGEALEFAAAQFSDVPTCERRVIDVSGDGSSNEGVDPKDLRDILRSLRITVNALVVEGAEPMIPEYFWENVVFGPGAFVITANSFEEYPTRMRRKLLREVTEPIASKENKRQRPNL